MKETTKQKMKKAGKETRLWLEAGFIVIKKHIPYVVFGSLIGSATAVKILKGDEK